MLLSMWMLEKELNAYSCESHIEVGSCVIRRIRIHQPDQDPVSDTVSICPASDLDKNDDRVVLINRQDMLFVEGGFHEICNSVIRIFEKYNAWSSRLKKAVFCSEEPFQEILNIGNELIQQPMYFGRNDMQLYAITQEYSSDDVFKEWDTIKRIHTIPMTAIDRARHQTAASPVDDLTSTEIDITPSLPAWDVHYHFIVRRTCRFEKKPWGHLIIFFKEKNIPKGFLQLVEYLGRIYESLLAYSNNAQNGPEASFPFLVDLIHGAQIDDAVFSNLYSQTGWADDDELIVFLMSRSNTTMDDVLFNWIYNHLRVQIKNSLFLKLETEIIIIVNKSASTQSAVTKYLKRFLQNYELCCGVSLPFRGLNRLSSFYQQTQFAVDSALAKNGKFVSFRDCAYECIARAFRKQFDYSAWIYPPLYELIELDKGKGTTYYKTLSTYLNNMGHLGNTVRDLYIHRNTLTNRLAFIEEQLGLDLRDTNNMYYLGFCCKMLEASEHHQNS
ncbi:MAG: helix-turn-helix domain-containing protein [Lachnospiraceae bacterium]|nr:helix-turn-helix domain-containing protein [Lachnospiraceae bacterium]